MSLIGKEAFRLCRKPRPLKTGSSPCDTAYHGLLTVYGCAILLTATPCRPSGTVSLAPRGTSEPRRWATGADRTPNLKEKIKMTTVFGGGQMQKAVSKIQTEMNSSSSDAYVQVIGGFLLRYIEANPHELKRFWMIKKR